MPPARQRSGSPGRHQLGDLDADLGRDLLGLPEIGPRGLFQRVAVKLHDALVALRVLALVDGQRQNAAAKQGFGRGFANRGELGQPVGIEAGIGAQRAGRREVGNQHVDRPVGARLQDELAVELQRRAEQDRDDAGLGQQPGNRLPDSRGAQGWRRAAGRAG